MHGQIHRPPTFQNSVHFSEGQVTGPTGPSFNLSVLHVKLQSMSCKLLHTWHQACHHTAPAGPYLSPVKSSRVIPLVFRPASYAHFVRNECWSFTALARVLLRRGIALTELRHLLCKEAP